MTRPSSSSFERDAHAELPVTLPLVGRSREVADLVGLLDSAEAPTSAVFIRGEEGVGKSRVASEFCAHAEQQGWSIVRGRAYPVESGTAYAVLSDAWLPALNELEPSTLTVLTRGGEAELRCLFPGLAGSSDAMLDQTSSDPEEFRTRLLWNFAEFVRRLSARTPTLCLLENLEWADDSSLQLVHFLARQTRGEPFLLVCTYDEAERDRSPTLVDVERSLTAAGVAEVLALRPLDLDQIAELIQEVFSVDGEAVREFAAVLFGWTRGNPFFAGEILKSLVASGRLRNEGGTWVGWDAKDFGMPGSIRDAVMARVAALGANARGVADHAAVMGSRAIYPLIEAVCELSPAETLDAVEELRRAGILEERSDSGHVVYDFRHPIVRRSLYEALGLQRARILHAAIAEAMEGFYGDRWRAHADELAFHFAQADIPHLRDKAVRYLSAAGHQAMERHANREALRYLEGALERCGTLGEEVGDAHARRVLPDLARVQGRLGMYEQAADTLRLVLDRIEPGDAQRPRFRRMLGLNEVFMGRHARAEQEFKNGLAEAEAVGQPADMVRLLIAQAHAIQEVGDGARALEVVEAALPLAERLGDPSLLARVHRALGLLHVWIGPPEAAENHGEKAIRLALDVGDLSVEFWARWGLAVLEAMRGDTTRLSATLRRLNELADEARTPALRLWTSDLSVELAYGQGAWDRGISEGERSIALARELNQRTLLSRLLVWTSQFYVGRGDLDRAQALVEEAVELSGIHTEGGPMDVHLVVPTYIGLAHYLLALGDYEDAIEAGERGLEIAEGTGYILWSIHQLLPVIAEACLWAGHIDRAEEVGRRMRAHAEKIDHKIGRAWSDACDALVQWKRGDPAGSIDLMRSAAEQLEAVPMIWPAARLRRQLAGRLMETGRNDEAVAELNHVHDVCIRLGAGLELERTRATYREMGARPPVTMSAEGPLGLTSTELQVAQLVAGGMSNKAVAAKLGCATRTVSTHLSNIYTKLDIGGSGARVRLGNRIRSEGLLD